MTAGLEEQGVGENGADGGYRQRGCEHVLRAVQQDAHRKSARLFRFDRNGLRATAAAARHLVVILDNPFRHFSSPEGLALVIRTAAPASASRHCLKASRPPAP